MIITKAEQTQHVQPAMTGSIIALPCITTNTMKTHLINVPLAFRMVGG